MPRSEDMLPKKLRYRWLRRLDEEYQKLHDKHYKAAPRNGEIPVGGGDWMDTFFRMESIRGMINALRNNKSLKDSLEDGVAVGVISIQLWNKRREWQVHRWEGTARSYLENLTHLIQQSFKEKNTNETRT